MSPTQQLYVERRRSLGGSGSTSADVEGDASTGLAAATTYLPLLDDFVAGRTTADVFEAGYLDAFRADEVNHPVATSTILNWLFFQVDVYYGDPALREEGDIDAAQLRTAASTALATLGAAVN